MTALGERIKTLREKVGWSQKRVADTLGISNVQLSRYETGDRKPDPDIIKKLADHFEVTVDYLLGRDEPVRTSIFEEIKRRGINVAFLGGTLEELTEEEAERLSEQLEMFRMLKAKRAKEKRQE